MNKEISASADRNYWMLGQLVFIICKKKTDKPDKRLSVIIFVCPNRRTSLQNDSLCGADWIKKKHKRKKKRKWCPI